MSTPRGWVHQAALLKRGIRRCIKCKRLQKIDQFHKDRSNKSGVRNDCKKCVCRRRRLAYVKHPEKLLACTRRWRLAHLDKIAAYKRRERKERGDQVRLRERIYWSVNREKQRQKNRRSYRNAAR